MVPLAWLVLWVPFFAALLIFSLLSSRPRFAGWVATTGMLTAFVFSLALLIQWKNPAQPVESSLHWVLLPGVTLEFGILVNGLTLLMLLVVTGVGSLIFLYSQEYMARDEGYARYFACLSFFAFSMLGIVLANNLIQIFIFWELVGLSSYLLIGYWFEKPEASDAGKKAFLTTRVGDVGFLLGILLLFGWLQAGGEGTFNFLTLERLFRGIALAGTGAAPGLLTAVAVLIFLGVIGKSAQFPLHVWLPDAMEGPTPVSALIHAATMVAAGVFLLARLFFIFSLSPFTLSLITGIGTLTAFFAATIAIVQTDIKRILAYSTLSQLGWMVASLGLQNPQAGMFHLTTHAFFKALLFLGAGSVIHSLHTQNIGNMPGLLRKMPVTAWTFLIGTLALVGIFPLSGFWSKEEILAAAYLGSFPIFFILLLTALLTAVYMGRLFAVAFLREEPASRTKKIEDPGWVMKIPLIVLAFFSIFAGLLPFKTLVPLGHPFGHAPFWVTFLGLAVGVVGFLATLYAYGLKREWLVLISERTRGLQKILEKKYYVDEFYNALIRQVQDRLAHLCDLFERYVVVGLCVNGTARVTRFSGHLARQLQTGKVQTYALIFSLGVTLITYGFILWNR